MQTDSEHGYLRDLVELSRNQGWKGRYCCLSEREFVKRTVEEMAGLVRGLVIGEKCFSQIK